MQRCYTVAFETAEFECLGLRLQPLTLGHAAFLMALDSPFFVEGVEFHPGALALAAFVCSHESWESARGALLADDMQGGFAAWGESAGATETALEAFGEYLSYYQSRPLRRDDKEGEVRVPWPWLFAWLLQHNNGMTRAEAWATTPADAFAWNACRCAYGQDESLMSEMDIAKYEDVTGRDLSNEHS